MADHVSVVLMEEGVAEVKLWELFFFCILTCQIIKLTVGVGGLWAIYINM
jgi:hypothetical protein